MIAAIYARKSTDQNLPEEEKAVTRQVERIALVAGPMAAAPPSDPGRLRRLAGES